MYILDRARGLSAEFTEGRKGGGAGGGGKGRRRLLVINLVADCRGGARGPWMAGREDGEGRGSDREGGRPGYGARGVAGAPAPGRG